MYLVSLIAPPPAHPVGPHSREEGQVVAVGLRQEHRLPRVQRKAGTGVSLLEGQGTGEGAPQGPARSVMGSEHCTESPELICV